MKDHRPDNPVLLDADVRENLRRRLEECASSDDALLARVKLRVLDRIAAEAPGFVTIRAQEDGWQPLVAGVERKVLHNAGSSLSYLVRFAPGTRIEGHSHQADEECLLLEGDIRLGDVELRPGDYHLATKGTRHAYASSRCGAVMFVRGAAELA